MAANNLLRNASAYLKKSFLICGIKPHLICRMTTLEQVQSLITFFGGVGCEKVTSMRGYARYLCHLDNPDKAQYNVEDVRSLGGADFISAIGLPTDKYKAIGEMIDWCEENNVVSYSQLLVYARVERFDWFRVLCDSGTIVIKEFLKSRKWTKDVLSDQEVDT